MRTLLVSLASVLTPTRASPVPSESAAVNISAAANIILPAGIQPPSTSGFRNATVQPSRGGQSVCISGLVGVAANTSSGVNLAFTPPSTQLGVVQTFLDFISPSSTLLKSVIQGTSTISGTYDIFVQLCLPAGGSSPPQTVQLLTHGLGFDHGYWDFQPGYSYVDAATAAGYATLSYDRLGIGQSDKPDVVSVVQAPLEVEIANTLATLLASGAFSDTKFARVLGVGHSFGSAVTQAVNTFHPETFAATALTGFSVNGSAVPAFFAGLNLALARENDPTRFAGLDDGFLVSGTVVSNQLAFFSSPAFDPNILALAEATKATLTWGELFSAGAITRPSKGYTAPLTVVNGANDAPYCSGNCSYPTDLLAEVRTALYPGVAEADFATYQLEGAGHGLNLHYGAGDAFGFIQDFFKGHGM